MEIKINHNLDLLQKELSAITKDKWPKILAMASTETAFYVRNKLQSEMPKYIDRPKPFTLNSIFVVKGKSSNIEAVVQWRQPNGGTSGGRYLLPTVEGGTRGIKPFEARLQAQGYMPSGMVAVPTSELKRDSYGNVPSGTLKRVLNSVTNLRAKGSKKAGGGNQYFAVSGYKEGLAPGIYERRSFGSLGIGLRLVIAYIFRAKYRKQFPFYEIGTQAAVSKMPEKVREAIQKLKESK